MNPSVASLICYCGIAGLFYLNRDRSLRTSKAVWLPVIWLWIIGSRPVSTWLGIAPPEGTDFRLEGSSPLDTIIYAVLTAAAIAVLISRHRRARALLVVNWPILTYFLYCLMSVAWSYYPDVSFKHWTKSIGDLAMVLVIVTEPDLRNALHQVFSRVGFLLFPISVLLIKFYPNTGRLYDAFGGEQNAGAATGKNMLGVLVLVISLGTLSQLVTILRDKSRPKRRRHLVAQSALLAFGISLLEMAQSSTSLACFALGGGLILGTGLRAIRIRPARIHVLCSTIFLIGGLTLLAGGEGGVAHTLGRKSNLSGRTDIWAAVIPTVPNSLFGAGFESYWISPCVHNFQRTMSELGWWHPELYLNEAHDGYIEVYLNLGLIGVCLISLILINGYRCAIAAFRLNPSIGGLILAYIVGAAFYNITEAGFRMGSLMWIFLLLAIASASGVAAGLIGRKVPERLISYGGTASKTPVANKLNPITTVSDWT